METFKKNSKELICLKASCLFLMFLLSAVTAGATGINVTSDTPAISSAIQKAAETPDYLGAGPTPRWTDEAQLHVTDLTAETMTNPLGIDAAIPRLSWIVEAGYNGALQ